MGKKETQTSKTRFFSMRRSTLAAVGLAAALLIALVVTALIVRANEQKQMDPEFLPRYTNIWSIYGDDSVHFVTLIFPAPDDITAVTNVAGPLVSSQTVVESIYAYGGEILTAEYPVGPGHDSENVYGLYTIEREDLSKGYGIEVRSSSSPYVNPAPDDINQRQVALGAQLPGVYKQVTIAVAFPRGTEITASEGETYTHMAQIGGWDVYYFDGTYFEGDESIRLTYVPGDAAPRDLNPWRVDSKR